MACYHPSEVSVLRKPLGANGRMRTLDQVTVPCGHCLGCRTDQARDWAIRLMHESDVRPSSWFATLTYEKLPEHGSLRPSDLRPFFKRLRRDTSRKVSYYVCGEYGEERERPHYHAVLFGPEFLDSNLHTMRHGAPVWTSASLEAAWPHGISELTGLTYEAAAYVAGYVRKKVRRQDNPEHYTRVVPESGELVELVPEFARMSRRPAIGRTWIERYWSDVYPRDFIMMNGHPFKPPRYYDKWMDQHNPEIMADVRLQRYEDAVEIGDEKLIMKEKIHRARVGLYQKRNKV